MLTNEEIYDSACAAGFKAGTAHKPTPMVFGRAVGLIGNEMVPGSEEVVTEGVCGFAWVNIKPATSSFARWMKASGYARESYYGGIDVWCREFNQSMERKEAWANAFCEVLNENDIRAYPMSRMD